MNYGELRTRIEKYFRAAISEGKRRRSEKGPFTQKKKDGLRETIELASMENMDYWQLLGREHARSALNDFCTKIEIDIPATPAQSQMVLDEIRKVRRAVTEAILDHGLTLEAHDFTEPQRAPLELASKSAPSEQAAIPWGCCGGVPDGPCSV